MIVKQIWTGNAYRNFNYLIACAETGEVLAVDPLDHEKCLGAAKPGALLPYPCGPPGVFWRFFSALRCKV